MVDDIPKNIQTLVIFNFRDLEAKHVITEAEVDKWFRKQRENVRFVELSLKNCFGFKELYTFINIPFLEMKKKLLEQQLDRTNAELNDAVTEVDALLEFVDYSKFLDKQKQVLKNQKAKKSYR
eukprot:UN01630